MILNTILSYLCYLLGAALFFLNVIEKYKNIADANPNPNIAFNLKVFWQKEYLNIIKVLLWGVASMILLVPMKGISVDFKNAAGDSMFNTSIKVIFFPLYFVFGLSGGAAVIGLAGKYKKELYNQVGITEEKNDDNP